MKKYIQLFELYLDLGAEIRDLVLGQDFVDVAPQIRAILSQIESELVKLG